LNSNSRSSVEAGRVVLVLRAGVTRGLVALVAPAALAPLVEVDALHYTEESCSILPIEGTVQYCDTWKTFAGQQHAAGCPALTMG